MNKETANMLSGTPRGSKLQILDNTLTPHFFEIVLSFCRTNQNFRLQKTEVPREKKEREEED